MFAFFLAVQDSSIGDPVTQCVTHLLISEHYRAVVDNVIMTMTMTMTITMTSITMTTLTTLTTMTTMTTETEI